MYGNSLFSAIVRGSLPLCHVGATQREKLSCGVIHTPHMSSLRVYTMSCLHPADAMFACNFEVVEAVELLDLRCILLVLRVILWV